MSKKITVSGVGCCLVDELYNNISFHSQEFSPYLSRKKGDGGLVPGQLVFKEEFEKYAGDRLNAVLSGISNGRKADKINIGGPCIVALIHAAQMMGNTGCSFHFYGYRGKDEEGKFLLSALGETPVNIDEYKQTDNVTPSTVVLSDPEYDGGNGERIFINSIGAAWDYLPEKLDDDFFTSEVVVFGGTALVPAIHDNLTELLKKAKSRACLTIVNTVYDFRNEKISPDKKWPLGKSDESYKYIDLLIVDHEEALRLSGKTGLDEAISFFQENGAKAVIITNGSRNIRIYSMKDSVFGGTGITEMPVSASVSEELLQGKKGDTTGCGDNFAGGVIYSVVSQLQSEKQKLNLREACSWGIVSGGFSCFYVGGTYIEKYPGEKSELVIPFYEQYKKQISHK